LREEFFKAATQLLDADEFLVALRKDLEDMEGLRPDSLALPQQARCREVLQLKGGRGRPLKSGKRIVVVTRPPDPKEVEDPREHRECIEALKRVGVKVVEMSRFHFKAVVIDDSIIYVGSINPLHIVTLRYVPADYMMRFVSEALVEEVLEKFMPSYQEWLK
jgi:hypothetical protein